MEKELLLKVIEKIFDNLKGDYPTPNDFENLSNEEQLKLYEKAWNNILKTSSLCFKAIQTTILIKEVEQ